ncbi:hypothetical protein AN216_11565 [Streptomyces oceani]|uniref:Uncharacterized protein n=1 Tax=Streptomyces oceani TaxID=1075402 RepID=A0A1E7KI04_9ACTN|nr:hypothetical protein AN216_11565 [Streptomyces oceani]
MAIGGGALATVAVASIVAVAVVNESGDDPSPGPSDTLPEPEDIPGGGPEPTFEEDRPQAPPEDYLASPEKDTAPLSAKTLFPDESMLVNGRQYTRAATDATRKCASNAQSGLGAVLREQDCQRLFRATYERDGLAFTLGVAVFDSTGRATAVKDGYRPNVTSLAGGDVPSFCRTVTCRTTVNALGRYAFFTIAGHTNGEPAGKDDAKAKQTALDGSKFGYNRVLARGKAAAEADGAGG